MSVRSMTGFAHAQIPTSLGLLACDIKSVNSRYLEISLKIPEELRFLEGEIRTLLGSSISRGKVECRLQWVGDASRVLCIDLDAMRQLLTLQKEVIQACPEAKPLTVSQILTFPTILQPKTIDSESLKQSLLEEFEHVVNDFLMSREREGVALSQVILSYTDKIKEIVQQLIPEIPEIIKSIEKKLKLRLEEVLSKTLTDHSTLTKEEVNDRIRQEVTLYAIKLDVDEEINRLLTHLKEIKRLLDVGGEVGKRLDFIVQELNREANTLGSKAAAIQMTEASLSLKINIEKIREQIQNLE